MSQTEVNVDWKMWLEQERAAGRKGLLLNTLRADKSLSDMYNMISPMLQEALFAQRHKLLEKLLNKQLEDFNRD